LDENEGIYVRNNNTGEVRAVTGNTYLLTAHESLWEKELSDDVEMMIERALTGNAYVTPTMNKEGKLVYEYPARKSKRDKTKVVSFKAPHNSAV
jgi:major vault protein